MPDLADRLANVEVSASAAMTALARDMRARGIAVISLSQGRARLPDARPCRGGGA